MPLSDAELSVKPGFHAKDTGVFSLACGPFPTSVAHFFNAVKSINMHLRPTIVCSNVMTGVVLLELEATTLSAALGHAVIHKFGESNLKTEL